MFLLLVARALILSFRYSPFLFLKCLHLLHLDPATTAIQLVSFDPIILSILRWTTVYASSIYSSPDSEIFIFSIIISQASTSASKSSIAANLLQSSTRYLPFPSTSFNFLKLNLSIWNLCDLCSSTRIWSIWLWVVTSGDVQYIYGCSDVGTSYFWL
jgi:hypothetical protein